MLNAIARFVVTFISLTLLLTWCFLNRGGVDFDFSPKHDPVNLPLFVVILAVAILGFLWGMVMTWLTSAPSRNELRQLKKNLREIERRLSDQATAVITAHPDTVIDGLLPVKRKRWWGR